MFPHRIAMLKSPEDVGAGGTEVVDLDILDPISRIFIKFKATNGDSTNIEVPQANITKVEIVDGSDVMFTMSGKAVDAVSFYDRGVPELHSFSYMTAYGAESMLAINFGRFPFDPVYALQPTKFRNLQLKITYDETLCNAACVVNELTVWAEIFAGKKISPIGFFQTKEQYAYTPAVTAYEEIDLPTDMVLRTLYIDALLENKYLGQELYDVRLDEDNLKNILYDGRYTELMRIYRPYFGKYEHKVLAYIGAGATEFNCAPSQELCLVGSGYEAAAGYLSFVRQFGCEGSAIADGAGQFLIYASGYMPHGIGALPFGDRQAPEDWYDPRSVGKLRLRLQGGDSAAGTYRILTQQVRMY